MRKTIRMLVLSLALLAVPCGLRGEEAPISLVLLHGRLIDGNGGEPIEDVAVVIRDGRIVAVGPDGAIEVPDAAEILDVHGATVLPGFINAHVHAGYDAENLRAWAYAGVTTVRDLGTQFRWTETSDRAFGDRNALNAEAANARLLAAGPIVTTVGGYGGYAVTSPEDARAKVDGLIDAGADVIKIAIEDDLQGRRWPMLTQEEMMAIVETAHARGIRVAAHVSRSEHVRMALVAGVDDVNHMAVDSVPSDLLNRMVEQGMVWIPTLELWQGVSRRYGLSWSAVAAHNLRRFVEAGGVVALGTDFAGYSTPFDLGMPITEIQLMCEAGMTTMQIIEAAPRNAAVVCGLGDSLGTIEPGKIADLLVISGDPLADLNALTSVVIVIREGVVVRDDR